MPISTSTSWPLAFLVSLCFVGLAQAQNYERYQPLAISPRPLPTDAVQSEPLQPVEGSDKVLVDSLNGIIFLDGNDKLEPEDAHAGQLGIQFRFDDPTSLVHGNAVQSIVNRYLGGPVTLRNLNQLSRDIILHYRRCGQPVVDVAIPEQKITAGVVQIVVIEPRIGKVTVEDGCYFEAEDLCQWVNCTRRGDKIYEHKLNNDLFWLNQNPFYRVSVDMEPGKTEETTDVIFRVDDVLPIRAYLGYEDTGVRSLGLERLYAGFIYGNAFGRGGILSYQYTADSDFNRLHAHSVSYSEAINRCYSWNTYGSWAGVEPSIAPFNQDGESWQLGLGLTRHLVRNARQDTSLTLGADFKQTNNNLEFGGQQVQDSGADLLELRGTFRHFWRGCCEQYGLIVSDTFVGPGGGFTSDNNQAAFNSIRAGTSPDYIYTRLRAERYDNVGKKWALLSRFTGQLTSERLLFSETLGYGGFDSIRGYDMRTFNADSGWFTNFEFGPRTHHWGCKQSPNRIRMFGFCDIGEGFTRNAVAGEVSDQFLASVGLGTRVSLGYDTSLRFSYGHGLEKVPGAATRDRLHIGFVQQFGPRP
ncbi:ShlB/FhaC/HecB family hemolysin secretion/activation protein [Rhodopirellula islandica]|nr:ShlB/FhaC/HecB family hemolysin secretion/activation protein [Rhodopirellula islandica]